MKPNNRLAASSAKIRVGMEYCSGSEKSFSMATVLYQSTEVRGEYLVISNTAVKMALSTALYCVLKSPPLCTLPVTKWRLILPSKSLTISFTRLGLVSMAYTVA